MLRVKACIIGIFEKMNNSLVLVPGVVVLMVHLDPQHDLCQTFNLNIRIPIEKLSYKHVSYAYLKK